MWASRNFAFRGGLTSFASPIMLPYLPTSRGVDDLVLLLARGLTEGGVIILISIHGKSLVGHDMMGGCGFPDGEKRDR